MVETIDSQSKSYKEKTTLIEVLGAARDDPEKSLCLEALSKVLIFNPDLSRKQQAMLIDSLRQSEVLTYARNFIDSGQDPKEVDAAKWDIEASGKLQAKAIATLGRLRDPRLLFSNRLELLVTLLNQAHIFVATRVVYADLTNKGYKPCLDSLREYESLIFGGRKQIGQELIALHVMNSLEAEELEKIVIGEFRNQTQYDKLMVFGLVKGIAAKDDDFQRFNILQGLMYLGYAMGVRDGAECDRRLQYEFGFIVN